MSNAKYPHLSFFLLCREIRDSPTGALTFVDVLSRLSFRATAFPGQAVVQAALGIAGHTKAVVNLDFLLAIVERDGSLTQPEPPMQHSATVGVKPGVAIVTTEFVLTLPQPGRYMVLLGDPGGSFGTSQNVLAEYQFDVTADGDSHLWN